MLPPLPEEVAEQKRWRSLLHGARIVSMDTAQSFVGHRLVILSTSGSSSNYFLGGAGKAGVALGIVVHAGFVRGQERDGILGGLEEQRRAAQAVSLSQGVREALPFGLGQQKEAEDGQDTERGEDDMEQEETGFLLEDDDGEGGSTQHADSQDQTEAGTPDDRWQHFAGIEDTQHHHSVGTEGAEDRDGYRGSGEEICTGETEELLSHEVT